MTTQILTGLEYEQELELWLKNDEYLYNQATQELTLDEMFELIDDAHSKGHFTFADQDKDLVIALNTILTVKREANEL